MPASDLFKDTEDAEFRLRGTYLVIGRDFYSVKQVIMNPFSPEVSMSSLFMVDSRENEHIIQLGRLPLWTMTYCPWGWDSGIWYCRGPARHRYQGITPSSLWGFQGDRAMSGGVDNIRRVLRTLLMQPKTRRPGKKLQGVLTRDVMLDAGGCIHVRGVYVGDHIGQGVVRPNNEPDPVTMRLLDNAKLRLQ